MLMLESNSSETPEIEIDADISAAHIFEDDAVIIAGNDHITIKVLDREFCVSPSSFFQVNTSMAEKNGSASSQPLVHFPIHHP